MKIKILILTLGIIITMICGVKINDFNTANNVQDNKIVTADENLIANEIAITQEEQIEEELKQAEKIILKNNYCLANKFSFILPKENSDRIILEFKYKDE